MKTAKELELSLLLKEKTIQELKLKNNKLEDLILQLKIYIKNNYQYVDDVMKQYFYILYIIKDGVDKE